MTHIFISYAKKDTRDLALDLADALDKLDGVTAWVDRSLRAGRSWELQIQAEIDRCDSMIVLYSPDINRHKQGKAESYVLTEIAYAKYTGNKPIIPVMVQETIPPISLTTTHYIDFTSGNLILDNLVDAICDEMDIDNSMLSSRPVSKPKRSVYPIVLPAPFEWITIPAGQVTLKTEDGWRENYISQGATRIFDVSTFAMAKYPITNAQFAKFVEASGYNNRKWWTAAGWKKRNSEKWTEPRYWGDKKWTGEEQPVVGVSWYEAIAFCQWLSEETGDKILLPTEQQWQRAVQGDDNRTYPYPWGDEWDCNLCNNSVEPCDSNVTTPVRQYEGKGDSVFGVVDMVGNVWEWCLTEHDSGNINIRGTEVRVLRGGSWVSNNSTWFRCDYRYGDSPYYGYYLMGFRVSRS